MQKNKRKNLTITNQTLRVINDITTGGLNLLNGGVTIIIGVTKLGWSVVHPQENYVLQISKEYCDHYNHLRDTMFNEV